MHLIKSLFLIKFAKKKLSSLFILDIIVFTDFSKQFRILMLINKNFGYFLCKVNRKFLKK